MARPKTLNLKTWAALFALSTSIGCTTLRGRHGDADNDGLSSAADDQKETVVLQSGHVDPTIASHDRTYFLGLRQKTDLTNRLRGALATGEPEAAVNLARARLAHNPGNPEALTMLSAALALSKNYDLAAYYADLLAATDPATPNAFALNIKGLASMLKSRANLADYQVAETYFQQAMDADHGQIAPGLNLGNLQLERGNARGAGVTFAAVAERCSRCTASLLGLGIASARSRDFDKALASFQEVLSRNPAHAGALYNIALVYRNGFHDNAKAETYLSKLLTDSRTKNVALREKAGTLLRMLNGEASAQERGQIAAAKNNKADKTDKTAPNAAPDQDDELLMNTGADQDPP